MNLDSKDQGTWWGAGEGKASSFYFCYDVTTIARIDAVHEEQFWAVSGKIVELAGTHDVNGYPIIKIVYTRVVGRRPIVAYRFTSDWAYDKYNRELVDLASSIERGVFDPFSRGAENHNYLFPRD